MSVWRHSGLRQLPGSGPAVASQRGLTLIELTISLMIVALLFSAAVVGIGALTGTRAKAAAAELAGTMRSLYDTAALSGKTCRVVFQLPPERGDDQSVTYTAECAAGEVTTRSDRDQALKDANSLLARAEKDRPRAKRSFREDEHPSLDDLMNREKERVEAAARFSAFTSPEVRPRKMSGVQISVWTKGQREPIKHGLAYVYFYPQGFADKTQVYFRQGNNVWTIMISPLTGKVKVVGEEVEVPRS